MGDVNESLEGLNKAIDRLIEDRDAALKRAEAAEAERRDAERRENAAYLEREQSARLRYRAEAALMRWDTQAIGAALGLPIGADVPGRAVGAIKSLRERAEKAEAEVARLRGLLEKRPEPYTPRVGDVVLFDGERAESAEATPRVVTSVEPDGWWSCVHLNRRRDAVACGPFRISGRIGEARLHRPATPAERAAAGLAPAEAAVATEKPVEPEAPAQPQVLPEHLAWIEACAEHFAEGYNHPVNGLMPRMVAARALVAAVALRDAAVALRDGGGK